MADNATDLPPYLPFATFRTAVQSLRVHGLPSKLDKSAWSKRSGADQGQIWGALRFLALIDEHGNSQPGLKKLVDAVEDTPAERTEIGDLLRQHYVKVFTLDLKAATPKQLDDAIGEYGVGGATRKRAVRFFVKAATHAGIQLSTRLTANLRERSGTADTATENGNGTTENGDTPKLTLPARQRRRKRQAGTLPPPPPTPPPPSVNAMKTIQLPGVGGTLTISGTFNFFGLRGAERDLINKIIDMMNDFEQKSEPTSE